MFDPFKDFDTAGYLRNRMRPSLMKCKLKWMKRHLRALGLDTEREYANVYEEGL